MTNLIPGFAWHPIDVGTRAKRVKGRGAVGHVAVSNSANLVPSGAVATREADWHWYNPKVGPGIQYIDLDLQCWASGAGNKTLAAFESQGGMGTAAQVNAEPWNDNQLENAARFYAHLVETEGAPLQVMPNSLPGSRGLAGHRLGIDPWRVAGGELWSSSRGKTCPGDAKMAQLPVIVSRANEIVHGSPTPSEDDMPHFLLFRNTDTGEVALAGETGWHVLTGDAGAYATLYAARGLVASATPVGIPANEYGHFSYLYGGMGQQVGDLHGKVVDSRFDLAGRPGPDADDMLGHVLSTRAEVAALADAVGKVQAPAAVDAAKLAAALLADDAAVAKLGEAIAAGLASRVHNG